MFAGSLPVKGYSQTQSQAKSHPQLLQPCQSHGKPTVFYCVRNNRAILDKIYSEKVEVEDSHNFLFRAPKAAVPDHEGCHRMYQPTRKAKGREIRSWMWKHKLSLLYAPLHILPWIVSFAMFSLPQIKKWILESLDLKASKSTWYCTAATEVQSSHPCLCPGQWLCFWAAEPSVKICRQGTCLRREGSHTVWLSNFPQQWWWLHSTSTSSDEDLVFPFWELPARGMWTQITSGTSRCQRPESRASLGRFSPGGIRAISVKTKALVFLPQLTLQVTQCMLLLTSTSTLILPSSLPTALCKPSLMSCQALQAYPLPSLAAWSKEHTAPSPLEGARLKNKKYKVTMEQH